jgi:IS5 family transposase
VQAKMLAKRFRAMLSVAIMSIGPFRSTLEPFREFIISKRRARLTWEEIAQAIREQGVACTRQAVQGYYKRQQHMRIPMGFESARPALESTNRPNLKQPAAEPRQIKKEKGGEWPTIEEANQIMQ